MDLVTLVLFALSLALALAISRIAVDVRKIRKHFDRADKLADTPAAALEAATPAPRRVFVPPPIRTPDPPR